MGLFPTKEERDLKWSEMSGLMKSLMVLVVLEAVVMGTGIALGVDVGDGRGIISLARALFGQGEILSETWLWVARLMVPALIVTVVAIRRESRRLVEERRGREDHREAGLQS